MGLFNKKNDKDPTHVEANATEKMVAAMTPCERWGHTMVATGGTEVFAGVKMKKMVCVRGCGVTDREAI